MPQIYKNIARAIAQGKPVILTYDSNKKNQIQRRRDALRGVAPAKKGNSLDEYPFASTTQGGKGASVMEVPLKEQNIQGGVMAATISANNMVSGDQFLVTLIPDKSNNPGPNPVTDPIVQPKGPGLLDYIKIIPVLVGTLFDPKNIKIPAPPPCGCPN